MPGTLPPQANPRPSQVYQIRVEGQLGDRWTNWFEGLVIRPEDDETVLTGPVADQAALHGLLKKVRDLGLPLVSVMRLDPSDGSQTAKRTSV